MVVRPVICRPFIGRRQELAYLRERRHLAARSLGGLVLVTGDAGIGKSRLITEFLKQLAYSRCRIGLGSCSEFVNRPYGPVLQGLSQLGEAPFEMRPAADKHEQLDMIVDRFSGISARTTAILIVEDLHFADTATLNFLAHLGSRLHSMRLLVVASVRREDLHLDNPTAAAVARIARHAHAGQIDLQPLKGTELETFIDQALDGQPLSDAIRQRIAIMSDGNPFFAEELLKSAAIGMAPRTRQVDPGLPQTLRGTILERLRSFDQSERRTLAQAAAIGRTFCLELLAATLEAEPSTIFQVLCRARDFQIIEEIDSKAFRFRHALTREVMYREFFGLERPLQHKKIVVALESGPEYSQRTEALAYHSWAAQDAARSLRYNELAGDGAAAVHAHEEAIGYYDRALELNVAVYARASITKKIARCRLALGLVKEANAAYLVAADAFCSAGAYEEGSSCCVSAALTGYSIGSPHPEAPLEAILSHLGEDTYLARSRVCVSLALLAIVSWLPTRAANYLALVERRALSETPDIALRFHQVAAFIAMAWGDLESYRRELTSWLGVAHEIGPLQTALAHANLAKCSVFFGLHEEAQEHLDYALQLSRVVRNPYIEEAVHVIAALCCLMRGDLKQGRAELCHVSPASESHANITDAVASGIAIGAALDDGTLIETWFESFEESIYRHPRVECAGGLAEIMARRGRLHDAESLLHRALPDCEILRGNVITLLAVARYGTAADRAKARVHLERAAKGTRELIEQPALALFDAIIYARDGERDAAMALARQAAEGFQRLRYPYFEAQAREMAGEVEAALAQFRRCGAIYEVRRLENGGRTRKDGALEHASSSALLSQREREIAVLAAHGLSNLDIARQLSISHKTVEKHLGSAYQKLRITSRSQLNAIPGIAVTSAANPSAG